MRTLSFSVIALASVLVPPALAQQSASYQIKEHVLNLAGHPERGSVLGSASYRISLDSLGDGMVRTGLSSASFHMDASFGSAYPPPGEVAGLRFVDATTLTWNPERSVGSYNAYRGGMTVMAGGGYGTCWQHDVVGETITDADPVAAGDGFFYLITAENRLREEGGKGHDGDGAERGGDACP